MVRTGRPACGRILSWSDWTPLRSGRDSPDGLASAIRAKRQSRRFYSSAGGFAVWHSYGYSVVPFHRKGAENEPAQAYTCVVRPGRSCTFAAPVRHPQTMLAQSQTCIVWGKGKAVGLHPGGFAVCASL